MIESIKKGLRDAGWDIECTIDLVAEHIFKQLVVDGWAMPQYRDKTD